MEPRLHNAEEISPRSHLCNTHKDVNVGRVAANKSEYYNPNHSNISYFRNPKPFHFWFHIYAIDDLDFCFDHLIAFLSDLNWMTMGAEVEFVYNVLNLACNYIYKAPIL